MTLHICYKYVVYTQFYVCFNCFNHYNSIQYNLKLNSTAKIQWIGSYEYTKSIITTVTINSKLKFTQNITLSSYLGSKIEKTII